MSRTNIVETTIVENYAAGLDSVDIEWQPTDTEDVFKIVFYAITHFLKLKKQKGQEIGFKVLSVDGAFKFGAIVSYEEASEDGEAGSWEYAMTFNEDDMKNCQISYDLGDAAFQHVIMEDARKQFRMKFDNYQDLHGAIILLGDCLRNYLDQNSLDEEVVVFLDDYVEASVKVEDGVKQLALVPIGTLTALIKSDAQTQETV